MLGNQLSSTLTIKTPLYKSSHLAIPAATTVNGVFSDPVGTSLAAAKNAGPAVQSRGSFNCTANLRTPWARNLEAVRPRATRVVRVRVDPDRISGLLGFVGAATEAEILELKGFGRTLGFEAVRRRWEWGKKAAEMRWLVVVGLR